MLCLFVWSAAFSLILFMSILSNNIVRVLFSSSFTTALIDRTEGDDDFGWIALAVAALGG